MASISAFWSIPGNVERLMELVAEKKYTGTEIARIMGITRNMCLGKAHRMRLQMLAPDNPYSKARSRPTKPRSQPLPKPLPAPADEPEFLGLEIMELSDATCRYPKGDSAPFSYCGRATEHGPYCRFHGQVCMVKPLPRQRAA